MSYKRAQHVRGRKPRQEDALPSYEVMELSEDIAETIRDLDDRRLREDRANDDDDVWGER